MAGKSKYSTHDIVNVFRCIARLIQDMPELLDNVGVFRLAGSKSSSQKLLKQLIHGQFDWTLLKTYVFEQDKIDSAHLNDILSMCNNVLTDTVLLSSTDSMLAPFAKSLHTLLNSDASINDINSAAVTLIDDFINALLLSNSVEYQRIGEILYHYCYLMHTAARYAETNKMSANNLAIILAPHFTTELELFTSDDLLSLVHFSMEKLTPILELYISDEKTSSHFTVRHADKLEHLRETRLKIIDKLNEMKAASRKCTVDPMRALMIHSKNLTNQISQLELNLHTESLKKDEKKQLKRQIKTLHSELHELDLELITLKTQIEEMNIAHAALLDTSQKLSLSTGRFSSVSSSSSQEAKSSSSSSNVTDVLQFGIFSDSPTTISDEDDIAQLVFSSDPEESSLSNSI